MEEVHWGTVLRIWKPKFEELGIEAEGDIEENNKGPDLLGDEITAAIKEIKKGKAVGVDEIPAEFLKIIGEEEVHALRFRENL